MARAMTTSMTVKTIVMAGMTGMRGPEKINKYMSAF